MKISRFARSVQPSATLAAGAKSKELKAQGRRVFDFALGEPDFNTPEHIVRAANEAAEAGKTKYTPAAGSPALRRTIADYQSSRSAVSYAAENICVSSGGKHALYTAMQATLDPGDEVLLPAPYWTSYADIISMAGGTPVVIEAGMESGFKVSLDQLKAAATDRTAFLVLNSPSNPTGAMYAPDELAEIARFVLDSDLNVVSDEIYERLVYDGAEFRSFPSLADGLAERTLVVNGASKTYSMSWWRIGWTAGPAEIIREMGKLQSQQTGCPCSVSQAAVETALTGDQQVVADMLAAFHERRDLVVKLINDTPGLQCPTPAGAFYAFFRVADFFGGRIDGVEIRDSLSFCLAALDATGVSIVPGSAFHAEGFARLSFAASTEELEAGLSALSDWLERAE